MRTPTRVLLAALLGVAVTAGPVAATTDGEVVGGDRLDATGLVVDEDAPKIPDGLSAASWLVADLDSGEVLAAKDPHGRYAPASTLKTLTALALIPVLDPARKVVPTFDDIAIEGSKVGLVERVGYPVDELFTALMMSSGNDAANVLASAAGGQAATAALMNDKARSLKAFDTVARNPHGLDADGQVSSAYDLALIARAGMADPTFARYASMRKSSVSAPGTARLEIYTKNKLLKNYEGALGIKNGYTSRARASFIGAAERDGRRLVVTLMKADPKVWAEAGRLLDWGFGYDDVEPVGRLVDPEPTPEEAAADSEGDGLSLTGQPPTSAGAGTGLPVTLAGMGLAAAALAAVRHRPARTPASPARPSPAPAQRRPAQRPVASRR